MPLFGRAAKTAKKNRGNLASYGFPAEKPSGMYYPGQTFIEPERLPSAKPAIEPLENVLSWNSSRPKTFVSQSPTVKTVGENQTGKRFLTEAAPEPTAPSTGNSTPASLTIKAPNTPPSPNTNGLSLPQGWAMRLNDSGQVYFEDLVSKTTQWNFPSNVPLPEGWSEHFNNTQVKYYSHPEQNSSWYRPAANGTRRNKANLGAVSKANIQRLKNLEAKLNNAEKRAANAAKALANAQNATRKNRNANLNALRKKLEEAERRAAEAEKKLQTATVAANEPKPQLGLAALMAKRAADASNEKPQMGLAAMLAKRAAPAAAEPSKNNGALPEKYAKMKKVGLPISAIRQKMMADGLDPNKYPQLKEEAVAAVVSEDYFLLPPDTNTRFAKYHKMRRAGVSEQNIKQKMKENKNAGILSLEAYNLATKRPAFTKKNKAANNKARPNATAKKPAALSLVNALKEAQKRRPKANVSNIEAALRKGNKKNNTAAAVLGNIRGKLRKTEVRNVPQEERVRRMLAEEQSVAAERAAAAEAAAKPTTYSFDDTW